MTRRAKTTATIAEAIAAKQAAESNEARAATGPTVLKLTVFGEPIGKQRARVFSKVTPNGRVVTRAVTPKETRAYEDKVRTVAQIAVNQWKWAWSKHDRFNVVIRIWRTHESRGFDLDNHIKVCDALNGVAWDDDRHVRGIGAALMDPDPKNPRMEIEVRRFRRTA